MDSYEFVRLQSELISEETMNKSYFSEGLTLDDYRHIPGIDWQDQLYRTAFQQNYNVSLSGGNKEGLRYNVRLLGARPGRHHHPFELPALPGQGQLHAAHLENSR